jgi:hypothetical protein
MKIVTAVVNNPVYIIIQYHTLKKFFRGDYEFIVFNDAKDFSDYSNFNDPTLKTQITQVCRDLDIKCINIPNDHHRTMTDACIRCADSMNYILKYQLLYPDRYLNIDSDMFLIDYFDSEKYSKYDCAVILQRRNDDQVNYFWNGIYYFDFTKMKNTMLLNRNSCHHRDVGSMMQNWINEWLNENKNHILPTTKAIRYSNGDLNCDNIFFIKHLWSGTWNHTEIPEKLADNNYLRQFLERDIRNTDGKYFSEIYDSCFLHLRAGGNWMREDRKNHEIYTGELVNFINKLL